ncbi:MAG TPA: TonB-dependent receptor [Thermoanaerobaculia bacterium]|nr:TonB-dependent receptor [Thermoanaerobaculia bacterium]
MSRLRIRLVFFALLLLALSHAALGQTTGSIVGHLRDQSGGALPGVTVEARSAFLQGTRVTTSDNEGTYRFSLLPPGDYTLTFSLQGFAPESRRAVAVNLGKDTAFDVTMKAATEAEITVTAEAPVLDTASTNLGTSITTRQIETLPTGRNYSSIVQIAPGVSSDAAPDNKSQSSITVYGSSGAENGYYIDGLNTTGVEYGFQGKELNFEFVQEVDVKTGGYEAEYGRSTGGIINVITKSGGNDFRGDLFGYYDNDGLQANTREVVSTGGTTQGFRKSDYGVDIGGYILKDRLWFFAAYDGVKNTTDSSLPAGPDAGDIVSSESKRHLGAAKLTFRLNDNQSLVGSFFQDPRKDSGAINDGNHTLNGEASTYLGRQDFGGRDFGLHYDGVFRSTWIASGQVSRHQEENSVGPATSAGNAIEFRDVQNDSFQTGGFGLIQTKHFQRDFFGTSLSRFIGRHELKGGIEYEKEDAEVTKHMSGGQRVDVFANPVNPSRPIYSHFYWTSPDATVANAPVGELRASPQHKDTTAYLQDRWSILPNLVANVGVRWDHQEIIDAEGTRQIDLKKDFAPRLGFTWDPSGDHKSRIFASAGRYYEQIPMDLVIRSFSFERQPVIINFNRNSTTPDPAAESDFGTASKILGGFTEPSDPNLKNQYLNEVIVGGDREVFANLSFGIKGIYRDYGNVIEDFLCADDGTYCIGNPGKGIMRRIFTLDYSQTFAAPRPVRIYKAIQLDANKRFSNNWQGIASYVYSKLEGNYDGEFAPFTNVGADPNISAAYDYYDFFTNGSDLSTITNRGNLSNDRRHQFKASGTYESPWKVAVGVSTYWRSGTPITRYGYSDAYGRYEFFLTRRGDDGRTPDNYDADLHLGYPLSLGKTTLNVLFDVFNVFNTQRAILVDERWGFQEADNASPTPVNPNYKKAVLRTAPTSVRLGLRLSF